jgi:hypothetical protein
MVISKLPLPSIQLINFYGLDLSDTQLSSFIGQGGPRLTSLTLVSVENLQENDLLESLNRIAETLEHLVVLKCFSGDKTQPRPLQVKTRFNQLFSRMGNINVMQVDHSTFLDAVVWNKGLAKGNRHGQLSMRGLSFDILLACCPSESISEGLTGSGWREIELKFEMLAPRCVASLNDAKSAASKVGLHLDWN